MPDSLEDFLLRLLREHPGERYTRQELLWLARTSGYTDASDRQVRKAIENLRANHPDGGWIVSSSDEPGYSWAKTEAEIRAANAEDYSRIQATSAKIENRKRLLRELEQQRVMAGRLF